jgi:hypothetical protein
MGFREPENKICYWLNTDQISSIVPVVNDGKHDYSAITMNNGKVFIADSSPDFIIASGLDDQSTMSILYRTLQELIRSLQINIKSSLEENKES